MGCIEKNNKLLKIIAIISLPLVVIAVFLYIKYIYNPDDALGCVIYKVFGVYCMGCGTTRQLNLLINGDIKQAFLYNVGAVIIYPAFLYLYYLMLRWAIGDHKIKQRQAYVLAVFAILLFVYMILRNIPIALFDVLRP